MRVIIAGSRKGLDEQAAKAAILEAGQELPEITTILSGGATGVDTWGEDYAKFIGVPLLRIEADWGKHGRAAGPIRNRQMAASADALILVWDGESRGSANMKLQAEWYGIRIIERIIPGPR